MSHVFKKNIKSSLQIHKIDNNNKKIQFLICPFSKSNEKNPAGFPKIIQLNSEKYG